MEKNYRKFHEIKKAFIISVCEGKGTEEFPFYEAYYVFDENLNKVGIIEPKVYKEKFDN